MIVRTVLILSLFTVAAKAAGAPPQLLGKTVSVTFSATVNGVAPDGSSSSMARNVQRTIYISSKGRIFSRTAKQAGRNRETTEREPEAASGSFRFEGNRMIGTNTNFISGAAQLTVTFDAGFQGCNASVAFGRESGKPFVFKGLNGKTFTAKGSPTAGATTCSVREGNPFGQ
jgi:hypothetical protein